MRFQKPSLSAYILQTSKLLATSPVLRLFVSCHVPARMVMDSPSETVSKPPVKCFYTLLWSWCLFTAIPQYRTVQLSMYKSGQKRTHAVLSVVNTLRPRNVCAPVFLGTPGLNHPSEKDTRLGGTNS